MPIIRRESGDGGSYVHPPFHPATMITEDSDHRFVTDDEKTTWNAKAETDVATLTEDGLMSSADKTKLDGVEVEANKYVHPNHSGDVTSTGDGATVIGDNKVSNAKLADMATQTVKGRVSAGAGDPEDITMTQLAEMLPDATTTAKGAVELATTAEAQAGTDATRAVTPATSGSRTTFAVTSTDNATSATAAPLKTAGGLAVAKDAWVGGGLHWTGDTMNNGKILFATSALPIAGGNNILVDLRKTNSWPHGTTLDIEVWWSGIVGSGVKSKRIYITNDRVYSVDLIDKELTGSPVSSFSIEHGRVIDNDPSHIVISISRDGTYTSGSFIIKVVGTSASIFNMDINISNN